MKSLIPAAFAAVFVVWFLVLADADADAGRPNRCLTAVVTHEGGNLGPGYTFISAGSLVLEVEGEDGIQRLISPAAARRAIVDDVDSGLEADTLYICEGDELPRLLRFDVTERGE